MMAKTLIRSENYFVVNTFIWMVKIVSPVLLGFLILASFVTDGISGYGGYTDQWLWLGRIFYIIVLGILFAGNFVPYTPSVEPNDEEDVKASTSA